MSNEIKDIIVEFAGWVRITPDTARFQLVSEDESPVIITGTEWLLLTEDQQEDYILEDVIAAQRDGHDGDYTQIDVFEDDSR